jgi:hypothetical protein
MLASGTQDRGFEPGRSFGIFRTKKIYSIPFFLTEPSAARWRRCETAVIYPLGYQIKSHL